MVFFSPYITLRPALNPILNKEWTSLGIFIEINPKEEIESILKFCRENFLIDDWDFLKDNFDAVTLFFKEPKDNDLFKLVFSKYKIKESKVQ